MNFLRLKLTCDSKSYVDPISPVSAGFFYPGSAASSRQLVIYTSGGELERIPADVGLEVNYTLDRWPVYRGVTLTVHTHVHMHIQGRKSIIQLT